MTPIKEILRNCQVVIGRVMETERIEDEKVQALCVGFVAALMTPVLAFIYVAHVILNFLSTVLPLVTLILMFALGLPVLTACRCVYSLYKFIYNVLGYFYVTAVAGTKFTGPCCVHLDDSL